MTAYYNEIDPFAAHWLAELIRAGHIAPGIVDTRNIEDVTPNDIHGFTQHHFFAGIGVWSYALRAAGWPDHRPVWTASCPCQPFSSAGAGAGFNDERHLWPAFQWLVSQCRPPIIIGEQVASKAAEPWIDLVQADLEKLGYAFGCVPFPSAGVGAPHIRDRAYWVGHAIGEGLERFGDGHPTARRQRPGSVRPVAEAGESGRLADSNGAGCSTRGEGRQALGHGSPAEPDSRAVGLADDQGAGRGEKCPHLVGGGERSETEGLEQRPGGVGILGGDRPAGPTNGFWRDADWLLCRDGKWRPVEPGTFPLVDGAPARVGRLRGYGNAINAEAARIWIETVMEVCNE